VESITGAIRPGQGGLRRWKARDTCNSLGETELSLRRRPAE